MNSKLSSTSSNHSSKAAASLSQATARTIRLVATTRYRRVPAMKNAVVRQQVTQSSSSHSTHRTREARATNKRSSCCCHRIRPLPNQSNQHRQSLDPASCRPQMPGVNFRRIISLTPRKYQVANKIALSEVSRKAKQIRRKTTIPPISRTPSPPKLCRPQLSTSIPNITVYQTQKSLRQTS